MIIALSLNMVLCLSDLFVHCYVLVGAPCMSPRLGMWQCLLAAHSALIQTIWVHECGFIRHVLIRFTTLSYHGSSLHIQYEHTDIYLGPLPVFADYQSMSVL